MKEKIIRTRLGNDNSFYFRCPFNVKIDDIVLVKGNDNKDELFLVEEILMVSQEETGIDLNIFKEVIKIVGNNKDLKLFKKANYEKIKISKKTNKKWKETESFLGYKFSGCKKLVSFKHIEKDAIISVWGTKFKGYIVARVGDVFDDCFVEFMFQYFSIEQFNYFMDNIKVEFNKYINKEISKQQINNAINKIRHS